MDLNILNDAGMLISSYGPIAVLVLLLLPLGEDVIIIPAGFLVGQGRLDLWQTFLCAYAGVLIADIAWYALCYRFGSPLLHKRWFKRLAHPRRLLQAKHQIESRGAWLIASARFVPGSRTSAMIMAGLLHMRPWKFLLAECSALLITVSLQLALGWFIAHRIGSQDTAEMVLTILGVLVGLAVAALVWRLIAKFRNGSGRAPRSRAAWLRHFRPKRIISHNVRAFNDTKRAINSPGSVQPR